MINNSNTNNQKEISLTIQNRLQIEKFKQNIKREIKRNKANINKSDAFYISLFLFFVAELEYRIKECLKIYKSYDHYDDLPLGKAIGKLEEELEAILKLKIKEQDYKLNFLILKSCYFIERCRHINKLRNDLYHNLFKEKSKSLKEILDEIKKRTETEIYWRKRFYPFLKDFYTINNLIDNDNKFWKLDIIIEFSRKYCILFWYLKKKDRKYLRYL